MKKLLRQKDTNASIPGIMPFIGVATSILRTMAMKEKGLSTNVSAMRVALRSHTVFR